MGVTPSWSMDCKNWMQIRSWHCGHSASQTTDAASSGVCGTAWHPSVFSYHRLLEVSGMNLQVYAGADEPTLCALFCTLSSCWTTLFLALWARLNFPFDFYWQILSAFCFIWLRRVDVYLYQFVFRALGCKKLGLVLWYQIEFILCYLFIFHGALLCMKFML